MIGSPRWENPVTLIRTTFSSSVKLVNIKILLIPYSHIIRQVSGRVVFVEPVTYQAYLVLQVISW